MHNCIVHEKGTFKTCAAVAELRNIEYFRNEFEVVNVMLQGSFDIFCFQMQHY